MRHTENEKLSKNSKDARVIVSEYDAVTLEKVTGSHLVSKIKVAENGRKQLEICRFDKVAETLNVFKSQMTLPAYYLPS